MAGIEWRPANSVLTLKNQLDVAYPGWLFLGFIGDEAHASVPSDHNPNAQGVVCAIDIGPGGGLDIHALARRLAANPHSNLKYIISNREIFEWQNGFRPRQYNGSDPHNTHIHISVGRGPDGQSKQPYDDTTKWNIEGEEMVTNKTCYLAFNGILNRPPNAQDLSTYVGKWELGALIEFLQQVKEREAVLNEWRTGKQALKDNWAGQIKQALDALAVDDTDAEKKITQIKSILK